MVKAKHILAGSVKGVEVVGGGAEGAAEIAHAVGERSGIEAETIQANEVVGFKYIADPEQPRLDELRAALAGLRAELARLGTRPEVEAVEAVLIEAGEELAKPQPEGGVVVPKLEKAAKILTGGAHVVDAADKLSSSLGKLVPWLVALVGAAAKHFGS
ncbi:MAG: hypothetical protein HC897_08595 [Thermoanaerobaculia bacterium]|nr:hypothetical protein [Thermoanaerobaculia bacterium]